MVSFPANTKVPGVSTGLTSDLNSTYGLLQSILGSFVLPSGDTTGVTDSANLAAAVAHGLHVRLIAGTYYLSGPLSIPSNCWLQGAGGWTGSFVTTIQQGSAFSGAYMLKPAVSATISDLQILGATSTIASNPQADGVYMTQSGAFLADVSLLNINFAWINGWCVHILDDGTSAPPTGFFFQNCTGSGAGGYGIFGASRTMDVTFVNASLNAVGGTSTTLDGLFVQDVFDLDADGCWFGAGNGAANTGHGIHLVGNCVNFRFFRGEVGTPGVVTAGGGSCGLKIEHGTNGDSHQVTFVGVTFQTYDIDVSLQGGCSDISFIGCEFNNSNTHGAIVNSTGTGIRFNGCSFASQGGGTSNGQGAATLHGTYYDLNWSGSGTGTVTDCRFGSPIVAVSTTGVQQSVNIALSQLVTFTAPFFAGTGALPSNWYTNVPSWQALPTLQNLWTVTAGHADGYRLTPDGDVELCFTLTPGTLTNGTLLFTLPAGYRPAHECDYALGINTSGAMTLSTSGLPALAVLANGSVEVFNLPTVTNAIFGVFRVPLGL